MKGDLRIVRASLHREIAAGMGLGELIAGKVRHVDKGLGPLLGETVAVLAVLDEEAGAEAEGEGEPRRRQAERLAGIGAGTIGILPKRLGGLAADEARRRRRPGAQHLDDVLARRGCAQVESGEVGVAL